MNDEKPGLRVALHGPGVTINDVIEAAEATKGLLHAVGEQIGAPDIDWQVTAVYFQCDGCGLQRPDRPGPDEGWTHADSNDYCPACSTPGPEATE